MNLVYTAFVSHTFRQIACYISCWLLNVNTRRFTKSSPTSERMWSSLGHGRRGQGEEVKGERRGGHAAVREAEGAGGVRVLPHSTELRCIDSCGRGGAGRSGAERGEAGSRQGRGGTCR